MDSAPPKFAPAYDLVLNGTELGGGSIRPRCRNPGVDVQESGYFWDEEARAKFGFFLMHWCWNSAPWGIALGFDRLIMRCYGKSCSLRGMIAFPKTQKATDLMLDCPDSLWTQPRSMNYIYVSSRFDGGRPREPALQSAPWI